jgi:hypothetical protein
MYLILIILAFIAFTAFVTLSAYNLGQNKTENPRMAALIGFALSFFPPFALVYLVVLMLKNDSAIV